MNDEKRAALLASRAPRLDFERNDATAWLQSAFARIWILPPPAAGPCIRTRLHRARARGASDAGIPFVMQRVVRKVARLDVRPHVLLGPLEQRADLPQAVALVPSHSFTQRALRGLFAAHTGDPSLVACDRTLEGLDLSNMAAGLTLFDSE